jgi:hypothetical protein
MTVTEVSKKVDPKGRSLEAFMSECGCERCDKLKSHLGIWPTTEAPYKCEKRRKEMKEHYRQGKTWDKGECPFHIYEPLQSHAG